MANFGPLDTYVKPGAYSKTTLELIPQAGGVGFERFAALIGAASNTIHIENYPVSRGSNSFGNAATGDTSGNFPLVTGDLFTGDGLTQTYVLTYGPITNNGGAVTNDPTVVKVKIDGNPVGAVSLNGVSRQVMLPFPPDVGSTIEFAYYWKRGLELITETGLKSDLDGWVNLSSPVFGTYGSIQTSSGVEDVLIYDPLTQKNKAVKSVSALSGTTAVVVDEVASLDLRVRIATKNATDVSVTYTINRYADTFDTLPAGDGLIVDGSVVVTKTIGGNKKYSTYVQDGNKLHWGRSIVVAADGSESSLALKSQISGFIVDTKSSPVSLAVTNGSVSTDFAPTNGRGVGLVVSGAFPNPLLGVKGGSPKIVSGSNSYTVLSTVYDAVSRKYVSVLEGITSGTLANSTYYYDAFSAGSKSISSKVWTPVTVNGGVPVTELAVSHIIESSVVPGDAANVYTLVSDADQFSYTGTGAVDVHSLELQIADPLVSNITVLSAVMTGTTDKTLTVKFSADGDATGKNFKVGFSVYASIAGQLVYKFEGSGTSSTKWDTISYGAVSTGYAKILSTATDLDGSGVADNGLTSYFALPLNGAIVTFANVIDPSFYGKETSVAVNYNSFLGNGYEEPGLGETYYVSFDIIRTAYFPFFVSAQDYISLLGAPTVDNELSFGVYTYYANGGTDKLAVKPIKVPTGEKARASDYIASISVFDEPMDDFGSRPSCITPLTTERSVLSYLASSCVVQSAITKRNERRAFFGFARGTTYDVAAGISSALENNLVTMVYPGAGIIKTDAGDSVLVDGQFIAVGMTALWANGRFKGDISEPYTNKGLPAFIGLNARLNDQQIAYLVTNGTTPLTMVNGTARIVQAVNTDVSSLLVREPQVTDVMLYIQRGIRGILEPYYGIKYNSDITKVIQRSVDNWMSTLKGQGVIAAYQPSVAKRSSVDLTTIDVDSVYSPTLPINWILVTLNLKETL